MTWETIVRTRHVSGWIGLGRTAAAFLVESAGNTFRDRIRPLLHTRGYPVLNEVPVARPRKFLDEFLPETWIPSPVDDDPAYESALIAGLQEYVRKGDSIVVVGGGLGVTAVWAARATGESGKVVCYEGVAWRMAQIENTLRLNQVDGTVRVEHAVVGPAIVLWGSSEGARQLPAEELPECDLLEMDCEGSELHILDRLAIRPRVILVETHGTFGAPTAKVRERLERLGYEVEDAGAAEKSTQQFCLENDVHVLIARRTATERNHRQQRTSATIPHRPDSPLDCS